MGSGLFITGEGGEGVGKTTFLSALSAALTARGIVHERGREPGGTAGADRVRGLFAQPVPGEPWYASTELLLVAAARSQHVTHRIRPCLAKGHWYLCDRFSDSTHVYQGILGGLPAAEIEHIVRFATGGLEPDLTFVLDCDVATASARIAAASHPGQTAPGRANPVERYDLQDAAQHEKVRQGFLTLARRFPQRIRVIDAARPLALMLEEALTHIDECARGR